MTSEDTKGYRRLAARMIHQAIQDFQAPAPCKPTPWDPKSRTDAARRHLYEEWRDNRRDAYTFFTDPSSTFALWASWLGLDPERIRRLILSKPAP